MPPYPSIVRLHLCATMLVLGACHHHHHDHDDYDASTNPAEGDDGGVCLADAGCRGDNKLVLQAEFNDCPTIGIVATPYQADVNQPIMVTSRAIDPDGDALTFDWTSEPNGDFDKTDQPVTDFHCETIGRKTIRLTVTDARGCAVDNEIEISCTNVAGFVMSGTQQLPGTP